MKGDGRRCERLVTRLPQDQQLPDNNHHISHINTLTQLLPYDNYHPSLCRMHSTTTEAHLKRQDGAVPEQSRATELAHAERPPHDAHVHHDDGNAHADNAGQQWVINATAQHKQTPLPRAGQQLVREPEQTTHTHTHSFQQ